MEGQWAHNATTLMCATIIGRGEECHYHWKRRRTETKTVVFPSNIVSSEESFTKKKAKALSQNRWRGGQANFELTKWATSVGNGKRCGSPASPLSLKPLSHNLNFSIVLSVELNLKRIFFSKVTHDNNGKLCGSPVSPLSLKPL